MFNLRYVLTTLASQHQDEVIHASHLAQEDFQTILKSMMQPFHDKMSATPSYQWPGRLQRQPVRLIGLQVFAGIEQKNHEYPSKFTFEFRNHISFRPSSFLRSQANWRKNTLNGALTVLTVCAASEGKFWKGPRWRQTSRLACYYMPWIIRQPSMDPLLLVLRNISTRRVVYLASKDSSTHPLPGKTMNHLFQIAAQALCSYFMRKLKWWLHFNPPSSEESDLAYLERVGGGGLVAVWSFFAPLIRLLLGQQVMSALALKFISCFQSLNLSQRWSCTLRRDGAKPPFWLMRWRWWAGWAVSALTR